jgi:hypothetical protein
VAFSALFDLEASNLRIQWLISNRDIFHTFQHYWSELTNTTQYVSRYAWPHTASFCHHIYITNFETPTGIQRPPHALLHYDGGATTYDETYHNLIHFQIALWHVTFRGNIVIRYYWPYFCCLNMPTLHRYIWITAFAKHVKKHHPLGNPRHCTTITWAPLLCCAVPTLCSLP